MQNQSTTNVTKTQDTTRPQNTTGAQWGYEYEPQGLTGAQGDSGSMGIQLLQNITGAHWGYESSRLKV